MHTTLCPSAALADIRAAGLVRLAAQDERLAARRFQADQAMAGAPERMDAGAFLARLEGKA